MTMDLPIIESSQADILSYSIVSSDEEENPLVVKLKLSSKNKKLPVVVLKKLENIDEYSLSPRTSFRTRKNKAFENYETDLSAANLRKLEKKSLSPKKRAKPLINDKELVSPKKRGKPNFEYSVDTLCDSIKNKVNLKTPTKRRIVDKESLDQSLDIQSPQKKKGVQEETPVRTPRSCSLRDVETPRSNENLRRSVRTSARYLEDSSPLRSVKVNLNESFRRSVLRHQLNDQNKMSPDIDDVIKRTPSYRKSYNNNNHNMNGDCLVGTRSARKSFAHFYYDTEEDDDIEIVEALKRSEEDIKPKRTLSSRSNSTVSEKSLVSQNSENEENIASSKRKQSTISKLLRNGCDNEVQTRRSKRISKPTYKISVSESDSDYEEKETEAPKTPKATKTSRKALATPNSVKMTPKTPKNTLKLLREGVITPSMQSRSSLIPKDSTPLMKARTQLHVSCIPTSLPCREKEYQDVYNFLKGKLEDECGGCMYISGVPGTGKTATVTSVIDHLQNNRKIPKFSYVHVNGMRLTEPRQAYVEIWKQLSGKTVPWEQAQNLLEQRFTKKKNMMPVVMLIDELDILCTRRQDVVYNLLDWPTKSNDELIVITIANTMDLPERLLMSRVTSRLGLTRLTFQAYTHKQLMEIVTKRLTGTNSFNPDAVQLVARKVASVSGDARRALDICRRAAEIAENEANEQQVNIMHINKALSAMITQPQITAIRRCTRLQKLLLQAIVAEIERTGVEETTFFDVYRMLESCCALDGFKMVSSTMAQKAVMQLGSCRLIITEQKCSNIYQKIMLNVSVHDVYFALKNE
ncbi:origin recognition complex subunit 1 [Sitophilus oryzae]|uniref:Origin recognition complex subunit 1 n=1 Tax=Sitophilus oryzae TaxID=7048 RepID=A0A6J2XGV8_SITOR|nr:origin recognition complex subunit 1 [Sitophilus oryzae]